MSVFLDKPLTWDNRHHFLYNLPHTEQVKFAVFCAKQIQHIAKSKEADNAIKTAELFLEGKATKEDCYAAYADAAAYAADAADAAAYAADAADAAAYAADAAAYAAYAADAAAYAADAAAYAADADAAAAEIIKQDQLLYLRELIFNSLPEEDKECWLLVASL